MTRGDGGPKRWLQVSVCSWLLVVSVVGAGSVVGHASAQSTTAETATALEPRFDFACEQVAVTARGYDSVTLVFADGDRQTFRWSFRGRNVFFGTGENVDAVVAEVVVRRDGEQVTRRNPSFETCTGRTATAATVGTTATATTVGTTATPAAVGTTATPTTPAATENLTTTGTPTTPATAAATRTSVTIVTPTTARTSTTVRTSVITRTSATTGISATAGTAGTATTTGTSATVRTPDISTTLDLPTIGGITTTATAPSETTVRGTTATIPTPTVTPRPIAGFPECSDEEFGLSNVLNLTYENGSFTSANATEIGENRFRFTVEGETYELELVEVERNDAGKPVSVTFDATLPMAGVIVRTGQGANVYEFPEGVSRRAGLRAPTNANTGQPFPIEEVAFCYDAETSTPAENSGGPLDDLGLGFLAGKGATVAVGLAAAGLLVVRRRRLA